MCRCDLKGKDDSGSLCNLQRAYLGPHIFPGSWTVSVNPHNSLNQELPLGPVSADEDTGSEERVPRKPRFKATALQQCHLDPP